MKMKKIVIGIVVIMIMQTVIVSAVTKIYPIADAYTNKHSPGSSYGTGDTLWVGYNANTGRHNAYLKFDVSGVDTTDLVSAELSLKPLSLVNPPTFSLYYVSSDTWTESVTWNTQPSTTSYIGSIGGLVNLDRIYFDINSYIPEGDGKLSFALISNDQRETLPGFYLGFGSREQIQGETYWPYIELTYEGEQCNTDADTNCDGVVSDPELLSYIVGWMNDEISDINLLTAISAWMN